MKLKTAFGLLFLSVWVSARPLVTGPELRAFLGGRTGKIVYVQNKITWRIYYIDLDDSILTERPLYWVAAANPMISPDGSRVLYEKGGGIYIHELSDSSTVEYLVAQVPPGSWSSLEPHWWVHPQTGAEYVTYTTGDLLDGSWPPTSGQSFIVRITGNIPVGPPTQLFPYMMSTGRSRDGKWAGTSHHSTGLYRLDSNRVDTAFLEAKNWLSPGQGLLACNGSISTSRNPARMNRIMHLTSGTGSANGILYDNHKAVFIRSWDDPDIDHPFWYLGIPGDNCNNDSSGNIFWGYPEWSTDEEYLTAVGSQDVDPVDSSDLYVVRINETGPNRILRVLQGDGLHFAPHLWIKNGVLPARIRLDQNALAFNAFRQDSVDPAPDTIRVSNSGDGILPILTVAIPAADTGWLKINVMDNGTNAPGLAVQVSHLNLLPGNFSSRVTVSYGQGFDSAFFTVTFLYSDPVLTQLVPRPRTAVLLPNDSLRLTASPFDQTGAPFPASYTLTWSGSPGLQISSGGLITTDSGQLFQTFSAYGTANGVACTVSVVVVPVRQRFTADSTLSPLGWMPDRGLVSAPLRSQTDTAVSMSSLIDPAPAAAYRTYRLNPDSLILPAPNGRYHIRLHFSNADSSSPPASNLTISLEGRSLGTYSIPPKPAGGISVLIVEADVTVADGNGLRALFNSGLGSFGLSAIEYYAFAPTPVLVLSPNGGDLLTQGDSLIVRFSADTSWVRSVGVQLSIDSGRTWMQLTRTRSVRVGDADWGRFAYALPDSLDGNSLVSNRCMISVYEYYGLDRDRSDAVFRIAARAIAVRPGAGNLRMSLQPLGSGRYRISGLTVPVQVRVTRLNGQRRVFTLRPESALDLRNFPAGILILQIHAPGLNWRKTIFHQP